MGTTTNRNQLEKIEKIISERFLCSDQTELKEENIDCRGQKFCMKRGIITSHELEYLLYRFDPDAEHDIFPFFNKKNPPSGLRKICDYILFVEDKRSLFIFLIEMKLGKDKVSAQQIASQHFIEYILKSAERVNPKIDNYHFRKIGIRECRSKKVTTKKKILEYDTNNFLEYNTVRDFRLKEILF